MIVDMKDAPTVLAILGAVATAGGYLFMLRNVSKKSEANCMALQLYQEKTANEIKALEINSTAAIKNSEKLAAKELQKSIYNPETGLTLATPREMCKECRQDCERRMATKHADLMERIQDIHKESMAEIKGLGEKIDQRNKDDQAYRTDMMQKVYEASGMIAKEGGTVNQVGAAIDEDRIVNRILAAINQSPK